MSDQSSYTMHYVCTHHEAREFIDSRQTFSVSNCGCRENKDGCQQSRIDVCLIFDDSFPGSGSNLRRITKQDAAAILEEARNKRLVSRPFRDETDKNKIDGICFCCQCCCSYFLDSEEACDKGIQIEFTDGNSCTDCGLCVESCYFKARRMAGGVLVVDQEQCYGCGLCIDACPAGSIEMKQRA